jgi:hypothetical protein
LVRVALTVGVLSLGGCEFQRMEGEEKINAAVPMTREIESLQTAVVVRTPEPQRKQVELEVAAQRKQRALSCAKGYMPSRFTTIETVRLHFPERSCFDEADAALAKWAGNRLTGLMLAEPALRPVPAKSPKIIVGDAYLQDVQFARSAGVALFLTRQSVQVMDIASGKAIYQQPRAGTQQAVLSANGRLFAAGFEKLVQIHNAETGALLLELGKVRASSFQWLGNSAMLYVTEDTNKTMLVDFFNGIHAISIELGTPPVGVAPVGDQGKEFLIGSARSVSKFVLQHNGSSLDLTAADGKPWAGASWAPGTSGMTGSYWFDGTRELTLISVAGLAREKVSFGPLSIVSAIATPDPGQIAITCDTPGAGTPERFVYSVPDRTVARIGGSGLRAERLIFIPVLKKFATVSESALKLLDELPVGAPEPLANYVAEAVERAHGAKMAALRHLEAPRQNRPVAAVEARLTLYGAEAASAGLAATPPTYGVPAKDAQVEAIGVYQPARPNGKLHTKILNF